MVIANPKGIAGPPYTYTDPAALVEWKDEAKQKGTEFIRKLTKRALQTKGKYDPGELKCDLVCKRQLLSMY